MLELLLYGTVPVAVYYALIFGWKKLRVPKPQAELPARMIALPLRSGAWQAFNSPASKVPSHGTDWLAQRFAIDLVGYNLEAGYSKVKDWRSRFWLEPPQRFFGFGEAVVAPEAATVVSIYDGMGDRLACRSWAGFVWFTISSVSLFLIAVLWRSPAGLASMAGNHAILRLDDGTHLGLMHLRKGSVRVNAGDVISAGDVIGEVGNTGNTTQPHLHVQMMDGPDPHKARPVPMLFPSYEIQRDGQWQPQERAMPASMEVIRPPESSA